MSTRYSVIIPVYNNTKSLLELNEKIENVFRQINSDYEVLFIDDRSPDLNTWLIIKKITKINPKARGFRLTKNSGVAAATLCGFRHAKGDYVITIDDDLQHNPRDIEKLIKYQEYDVVIASFKRKYHNLNKILTSKIKSWFDLILIGKPKHIYNSSFRLIKRNIIDSVNQIQTTRPMIAALLYRTTSNVINVEVEHSPRKFNKSEFNFTKRFLLFSNLLINNSDFLLKLSGLIGILYSILSLIYALILIIKQFVYQQAPTGWTSIMVVILFTSGLLFIFISIIGEYLSRLIESNERYPAYSISDSSN